MRRIILNEIADAVMGLRARAERWLPPDVGMMIECASETEGDAGVRARLTELYGRFMAAGVEGRALGEATRSLLVFLRAGADVEFDGFEPEEAVRQGAGGLEFELIYEPAAGEGTALTVMPMSAGCRENCFVSPDAILLSDREILKCAMAGADTGSNGGLFVAGIGLAGSAEAARLAALRALRRPVDRQNPDKRLAALEHYVRKGMNARAGAGVRSLAAAVESDARGEGPGFCAVSAAHCLLRRAEMIL